MLAVSVVLACLVWSGSCMPDNSFVTYELSQEIDSSEFGQFKGPKSTNCTCGWTNKDGMRIVGGVEAGVNQFPYMAGLGYTDTRDPDYIGLFCGGTIVTPYHVITAAHCVYDESNPKSMGIVVGEHNVIIKSESRYTKVYRLNDAVVHPGWSTVTYRNDIAVLVTKERIEFNQAVGPACLPTRTNLPDLVNEHIKVTGWGDMRKNGDSSNVLLKVNLKVLDLKVCHEKYPRKPIDIKDHTQLCTYSYRKDSCQGDSGGPLTWLDPETNRYTLVGVVSFGTGCASFVPGVNTFIPPFLDWIQKTIAATSPSAVRTCAKLR